jgi:DNA oxidative demethylase
MSQEDWLTNADGFRMRRAPMDAFWQKELLAEVRSILEIAPLIVPRMPRTGKPFSVRMSNAGALGWVSDQAGGYRYEAMHPETGAPWPPIPERLLTLWDEATDGAPRPEACLINWYAPDAKMGLHVDADEAAKDVPVLSVSLGASARFQLGGLSRRDPVRSMTLHSGDVVVLAGMSRSAFHGIPRLLPATSGLLPDGVRINLTLRRVTLTDKVF